MVTTLWSGSSLLVMQQPHWGLGLGFEISHRHNSIASTPLENGSACRGDLYLTIHNTHKRQTSIFAPGFEPAISASERQQTDALEGAATVTGM